MTSRKYINNMLCFTGVLQTFPAKVTRSFPDEGGVLEEEIEVLQTGVN